MWQETYDKMKFGENWEFTWWSHESCFIIKHSHLPSTKMSISLLSPCTLQNAKEKERLLLMNEVS